MVTEVFPSLSHSMIRPHLAFGCTAAAPCTSSSRSGAQRCARAWGECSAHPCPHPLSLQTLITPIPQTAHKEPSNSPRLLPALRTVAHATIPVTQPSAR